MNQTVLYTVLSLSGIGVLSAVILYFVAKKFHVVEDPRIDEVEQELPGANCGACGYPGCRNFAEACVKADDLEILFCPVGGNACMAAVAHALGKDPVEKKPMIAVVRCNGSLQNREKINIYDSAKSCTIASFASTGETGCAYGCFGLGDCVRSCKFDAIYIDEKTGLPVISEEKCTSCGACVKACPKKLIELRFKGPKNKRIFVACSNTEKGGVARKNCKAACIGCGKCVKECPFDAIKLENCLAYIDFEKCKLCRKCVAVCPTHAIHELHFPPRKIPEAKKEEPVVKSVEATDPEEKKEI